ncbi:MAG: hypothetical protein Q4F65_07775 [Propionibacteriaceae bacterium]|nr:hypothetical protein [Propionibacteriaceae bacterium]
MERLIEGTPGQEAAVWVQDRGGGPLRLRGHVLIEDLSGVLTRISSASGANGPLNPVTQFMLERAANHLAERLIDDARLGRQGRESVPRILSSALGHQPFIESVLEMSQHQMLRRWPLATDWYTDVINYVMRPTRFDDKFHRLVATMTEHADAPLGAFVRTFAREAFTYADNTKVIRVAEALQSLWPDYPPVRNAMASYRQHVKERYVPLYEAALEVYNLHLRPGLDLGNIGWAFNALHAREALEFFAEQTTTHTSAQGDEWSMTAWTVMLIIAGSVTDAEGNALHPDELAARLPSKPFSETLAQA